MAITVVRKPMEILIIFVVYIANILWKYTGSVHPLLRNNNDRMMQKWILHSNMGQEIYTKVL